ncbi:Ovochymase-1, partial [Aphelenchoides avenae]
MRSVVVVLLALNACYFGERVSASECGIAHRPKHNGVEKVAGGYAAEQWRWPWAAALRIGCSGTLISSRHVLTAGHCYHADKDP